jgi:vitamin B12 transporter
LEIAPFGVARVRPYWLAVARVAYALKPGIELFARGTNLFDANYQEVAGYHTEGLGVFTGIRLASR